MATQAKTATVLAGLLLAAVAAQSVGMLPGGTQGMPTITAPASVVMMLPLFNEVPLGVVLVAVPLLFWAWASPLFAARAQMPPRTIWLFRTLVILSIAWFAAGWKYGLQFEGRAFTIGTAAVSVLCVALVELLVRRSRRSPSFAVTLAATWLIFAWTLTFAFPYLGETP